MARASDPRKVLAWKQRLARFQAAGVSVARFCHADGVSVPTFYPWRKKLAPTDADEHLNQSSPRRVADLASAFTPMRLLAAVGVGVELPGGLRVQFRPPIPHSWWRNSLVHGFENLAQRASAIGMLVARHEALVIPNHWSKNTRAANKSPRDSAPNNVPNICRATKSNGKCLATCSTARSTARGH